MSNYKKDKSYIKQRLEYVSPVDYISELEEKIEYLEYLKNENERLNNIIDKAIEYIEDNTYKSYETDYMDLTGIKELLNILNGGDEE
jgi:cell shape-determining protein MreC